MDFGIRSCLYLLTLSWLPLQLYKLWDIICSNTELELELRNLLSRKWTEDTEIRTRALLLKEDVFLVGLPEIFLSIFCISFQIWNYVHPGRISLRSSLRSIFHLIVYFEIRDCILLLTITYIPIHVYHYLEVLTRSEGLTYLEQEYRRHIIRYILYVMCGMTFVICWDCFYWCLPVFCRRWISGIIISLFNGVGLACLVRSRRVARYRLHIRIRERVPEVIGLRDVTCPVCHYVMVPPIRNACIDPVQMLAQHPICNKCLDQFTLTSNPPQICPVCQAPLIPSLNEWANDYVENNVSRCPNFTGDSNPALTTCLEAFDRKDQFGLFRHTDTCPHNFICHLNNCRGHLVHGGPMGMYYHIRSHMKLLESLPQVKALVTMEVCSSVAVSRRGDGQIVLENPLGNCTNEFFGLTYDTHLYNDNGSVNPVSASVSITTTTNRQSCDGKYCVFYLFIVRTMNRELYAPPPSWLRLRGPYIIRHNTSPNIFNFQAECSTLLPANVKSVLVYGFANVFTCEDAGIL